MKSGRTDHAQCCLQSTVYLFFRVLSLSLELKLSTCSLLEDSGGRLVLSLASLLEFPFVWNSRPVSRLF